MSRELSLTDGGRASKLTAERFRLDGFGEVPAFHAMIAETGGTVTGYAIFYHGYDTDSASRGVYLADLYVAPEHRRAGVGRALMREVAKAARRDGARWMFWSVLKRNRGARKFYRHVSQELRDVIICAAFGQRFDELADDTGPR